MAKPLTLLALLCALLAIAVAVSATTGDEQHDKQSTYIVHVSPVLAPSASHPVLTRAYSSLLRRLLAAHLHHTRPSLLYSYAHATTGFAARLTAAQAADLSSQPSVLAVLPDGVHHLHTTLTPSFLELTASNGLLPAANSASDVVIGVLDSGIYPINRTSFAAPASLPPPPPSFRGRCVSTPSFNASVYCNNKLVGAKFFRAGYEATVGYPIGESNELSPLDSYGHGTHTASTAAGSAVPDAGFYDYARGKAVGMAPAARIAAYKVCWPGCVQSDILAGIDEAIADGVDIISMSLGTGWPPREFYADNIAIGTFGAVRKGILVSCSAGNSGPRESTVVNIAPWMLTVGASTINRQFPADVILGSGITFTGSSLYAGGPLNSTKLPLVSGGDVGSEYCGSGSLDEDEVTGKIVVCKIRKYGDQVRAGAAVLKAHGAGAIFINRKTNGEELIPAAHLLPATLVTYAMGERILDYIMTDPAPTATIVFRGTVIGPSPAAPRVAAVSSRGPSYRAPEILKPDIIAPGVNILAAWTGDNSPTEVPTDQRRVEFSIMSGTSMACPHVSGIAALLHQARPDWSPAAIKSAIMTTAYNVDSSGEIIKDLATGKESTPFVRGAGHVDPNSALDAGLIYDAGTDDYIAFLCSRRYSTSQIVLFTRDGSVTNCSTYSTSAGDLNYPSFSVVFSSHNDVVTHRRVVRNVGSEADAVYEASVSSPAGVDVTVKPSKLVFDAEHQSLAYEIMFAPKAATKIVNRKYAFGSIVWSDGEHKVTSPIVVALPVSQVSSI